MQHQRNAKEAANNAVIGNLNHVIAFPEALGTGIVVHTEDEIDTQLESELQTLIDNYETVLSRFRHDSLVTAMSNASHGGSFDFPDYLHPLFEIYDRLFAVTEGKIDPLVGADLTQLGYGADINFHASANVKQTVGAIHGRPQWNEAVTRHGTTLITHRALQLDFGAVGKGFLVDLLSSAIAQMKGYVLIDAGGDLRMECGNPIRIALEDPSNDEDAVGMAEIQNGSLCASAPSRRQWPLVLDQQQTQHSTHEKSFITMHHLLNAIDGMPANDVAATWVAIDNSSEATPTAIHNTTNYPTAWADGLSTALFVCDPVILSRAFAFECAVIFQDRTALLSQHFPGSLFAQQ
ncbi:FAD:protein FMN transferase [Bifidobacterium sp.]|jgi:thiamine biosynthesis lipoprotein|uniref:FAD:protein FMN transferase n=1 Tax=Bifidobacterium sp. TaxID=41200 RepID=UPI0025C73464|nr:FAD:protein FMN transferase [Bifidobacterium sp.]MCI1634946.1 FAD:protein FMN transferase [Bifidobacterium sp.]